MAACYNPAPSGLRFDIRPADIVAICVLRHYFFNNIEFYITRACWKGCLAHQGSVSAGSD